MPNGSGRMMSEEASVNIGALQQRVYGLETGQRSMADSVSALSSKVETLFASLASKIEERSRPQYPLLISIGLFGLAVVSSVGWLAYAPIRENQTDLKIALVELSKALAKDFVTIRELDNRSARTTDERKRLEQDVNGIQKELVPRAEHAERWRSVDKQFEYQQRQLDERKRFESDMISVPSFLKDLNERVRAVEIARAKGTAP
jgi:hypothetical protein